jgi:hypothetical protein
MPSPKKIFLPDSSNRYALNEMSPEFGYTKSLAASSFHNKIS